MIVVGIDPGADGAIAFIGNYTVGVSPLPWTPIVGLDTGRLAEFIEARGIGRGRFFIERVQTRVGQGVAQACAMGMQYGRLLERFAILGISVVEVPANRWKAALGLVDAQRRRRTNAPTPPRPVYPPKSPEAKAAARAAREAMKGRKARSIAMAQRMFPGVSLLRTPACKVPSDGMAEALLIAEYGRRQLAGSDGGTDARSHAARRGVDSDRR